MQKGIIKNVNQLTGEPINAQDLASLFSGIIGNESGVLTVFDELRLEKISDNKVRLHSGVYSLKGHILYIPKGSYEDFEIESGTLGANRIDLLVAEYVKNGEGDGEDALQFKVIKGKSTSGSPQSPDLIQQDINENGLTHQEALYNLRLTGTSLNITKNYQRHFSLQDQTRQLEQAIKNQEDRIEEGFTEINNKLDKSMQFQKEFTQNLSGTSTTFNLPSEWGGSFVVGAFVRHPTGRHWTTGSAVTAITMNPDRTTVSVFVDGYFANQDVFIRVIK